MTAATTGRPRLAPEQQLKNDKDHQRQVRKEYFQRARATGYDPRRKKDVKGPTYLGILCKHGHGTAENPGVSLRWTASRGCVECHKLVIIARRATLRKEGFGLHGDSPRTIARFQSIELTKAWDIAMANVEPPRPWLTHPAYADIDFSERGFEICPRCRQAHDPREAQDHIRVSEDSDGDTYAQAYDDRQDSEKQLREYLDSFA